MDRWTIVKVQTPAVRFAWRRGRELRFGAHNFLAVLDPAGGTACELHSIARGPDGAQLLIFGGIVPFRREYVWGETYAWRTGFFDPSFPQFQLLAADRPEIDRRLAAAARVQAEVNRRNIRYPWPAFFGANSNAYCSTLIRGMGLRETPGELWEPSARRMLLPPETLEQIAPAVPPGT